MYLATSTPLSPSHWFFVVCIWSSSTTCCWGGAPPQPHPSLHRHRSYIVPWKDSPLSAPPTTQMATCSLLHSSAPLFSPIASPPTTASDFRVKVGVGKITQGWEIWGIKLSIGGQMGLVFEIECDGIDLMVDFIWWMNIDQKVFSGFLNQWDFWKQWIKTWFTHVWFHDICGNLFNFNFFIHFFLNTSVFFFH